MLGNWEDTLDKRKLTLSKLKERFYWPGQYNDVRDWCSTCAECASRKTPILLNPGHHYKV